MTEKSEAKIQLELTHALAIEGRLSRLEATQYVLAALLLAVFVKEFI
jgi:hypothetical protein